MRNKIKEWLNNPEHLYKDGLGLYDKTKISTKFDKFFALVSEPEQSDLPFKMLIQQLQNALRKIEQNPVAEIVAPKASSKAIGTGKLNIKAKSQMAGIKVLTEIELTKLPEALQTMYLRTKQIVPEMNAVQQELRGEELTEEQRKVFADQLCELEDEKDACWKAIDAFGLNIGKPKEETKDVDPVAIALAKKTRIDNLVIYIGRTGKSIDEGKVPYDKQIRELEKIELWKKELSKLKAELGEITK